MAQIIVLGPPPASKYLTLALRLAFIKTLAILIADAILRFMFDDLNVVGDQHPVMEFLNNNIYPLVQYPLWVGGINTFIERDHILTGAATLLLLVLLWPATLLWQFGGAKIGEYNERLSAGQSVPNGAHRGWYLATLILAGAVFLWRTQGDALNSEIPPHFYYLLRLSFTLMASVGAASCLYVAFSLHNYQRRLSPRLPKSKPTKSPKLKVVASTLKPQPAPRPASAQRALLVALTAELIQFCGQNSKLPTAGELAGRLGPLLRAAQVTGAGVPSPGELEAICQQTLALLAKGKLVPLTNLKEAQKLYKKPGNAIDKIVSQLELYLKT